MLKIKCLVTFKDGNIFPEMIKIGQILTVTEGQYEQIKASGGMFDVVGKVIPPPTKAGDGNKA